MDSLRGHFSTTLRQLRMSLGYSQAEAAERLGLAAEAYGRLERGSVLPRVSTLVRLAKLFNVSTDSLLGLQNVSDGEAGPEAWPGTSVELKQIILALEKLPTESQVHLASFLRSLSRD